MGKKDRQKKAEAKFLARRTKAALLQLAADANKEEVPQPSAEPSIPLPPPPVPLTRDRKPRKRKALQVFEVESGYEYSELAILQLACGCKPGETSHWNWSTLLFGIEAKWVLRIINDRHFPLQVFIAGQSSVTRGRTPCQAIGMVFGRGSSPPPGRCQRHPEGRECVRCACLAPPSFQSGGRRKRFCETVCSKSYCQAKSNEGSLLTNLKNSH